MELALGVCCNAEGGGREGIEVRALIAAAGSVAWSQPKRPACPFPPRVQALLSRGDRRLSRLLLLVRGYGDSLGSFRRAFKELQVGLLLP